MRWRLPVIGLILLTGGATSVDSMLDPETTETPLSSGYQVIIVHNTTGITTVPIHGPQDLVGQTIASDGWTELHIRGLDGRMETFQFATAPDQVFVGTEQDVQAATAAYRAKHP